MRKVILGRNRAGEMLITGFKSKNKTTDKIIKTEKIKKIVNTKNKFKVHLLASTKS